MFTGGTFLFVFIAGFLFQYLSYKFNYKTYLKKKFKNVILPYWITMLPVASIFAFTCVDKSNFLYSYPPIVRFLEVMAFGEIINVPLWFIPMIIIFFITAPILLWLREKKVLWYSIFLFSLIYTIVTIRPGVNLAHLHNLFQYNINYFQGYINCYFYFYSTYVGGMIICELIERYPDFIYKTSKNFMFISLVPYILGYWLFVIKLGYSEGQLAIAKMLTIIWVLAFFITYQDKIKSIPIVDKTLKFFAKYSFGIFFIHFYPLNIILHKLPYRTENWYNSTSNSDIHSIFCAILYFIISLGFSVVVLSSLKFVLNKLGVKNTRMFIGV